MKIQKSGFVAVRQFLTNRTTHINNNNKTNIDTNKVALGKNATHTTQPH
jgi:hypothetical protein